jgi:KUP system potassium uptake protein
VSSILSHSLAHAAPAAASGGARLSITLGVLGVVYGDIGTSPLYAFKQSIVATGGLTEPHVLGVLSLMIWALLLVVTVKYVLVVMRADNRGEGGILAVMALALRSTSKRGRRHRLFLVVGLLGAALFYGDGVLTPAISVLSAIEGLSLIAPNLADYVVPVAVGLLLALFLLQRFGTARVGLLFGPVIAVWFAVLGLLGLLQVAQYPDILRAADPRHGLALLIGEPLHALAILGAVVLTVTGAEALYADLGHFGRRAIGGSWLRIVLPALLLNYLGQGALVLTDPAALVHPFYHLVPTWSLAPLVILASAATIIASQAVISGAFSLTQQAVQLGYLPRLRVRHTSAHAKGQVYVPAMNLLLMLGVLFVVLEFKSSEALATAYGIAVTGTMTFTAVLAAVAMYTAKRWPLWTVLPVFAGFLAVDLLFLGANLIKVVEGGWLPLAFGAIIYLLMMTWIAGRRRLLERRVAGAIPLEEFLAQGTVPKLGRVAGTAVYLVAEPRYAPTALLHNLKHNKVLHERVVLLGVQIEDVPRIANAERVAVERLQQGFHRVVARFGYLEEPSVPRVLALARARGLDCPPMESSFFVGREKVVVGRAPGMAAWRKQLFILMNRAMLNATDYFHLPPNRVVELGGQVEI